jgi:outer membrane protein TolC
MARLKKGIRAYIRQIAFFGIALVLSSGIAKAQTVLDEYIQTALNNNLSLKEENYEIQKRYKDLQTARSLFYPKIELQARYTVAEGGRTIDFPVGDLLNPVYGNLNSVNQTLYGSLPPEQQPDLYPNIDNQSFNFYRPTEHETKIELRQNIFVPRTFYNRNIKAEQISAEGFSRDMMQNELIAEVKKAYFNYLKTLQIQELLTETQKLAEENLRVSQKLHANDKVTKDHIYTSEAELQELFRQQAQAEKNRKSAEAYFNFLLNRPLQSEIIADTFPRTESVLPKLEKLQDTAINTRAETKMLESYRHISEQAVKAKQSQALPDIIGVVSYGFQGEKYRFDDDHDFMLASVIMRWPLFTGLENSREIQKAKIEQDIIRNRQVQNEQKIKLEIIQAYYALEAAEQSYKASLKQEKSRQAAFGIIEKKYENGQSSLLEYLDARNRKTQAEVNAIINKYDVLIKLAELEKTAALNRTSYIQTNIRSHE